MCGREDKNVLLCTVLKAQATVLLYDQLTEEQEDLLLVADLGIISAVSHSTPSLAYPLNPQCALNLGVERCWHQQTLTLCHGCKLCGARARGRGAGQSGREDEQCLGATLAGWGVQHERVVNTTLRVGSHWARGKGGLGWMGRGWQELDDEQGCPGKRVGPGDCQKALARRKYFYPQVLQYIYSTLVDNGKPILPVQI